MSLLESGSRPQELRNFLCSGAKERVKELNAGRAQPRHDYESLVFMRVVAFDEFVILPAHYNPDQPNVGLGER